MKMFNLVYFQEVSKLMLNSISISVRSCTTNFTNICCESAQVRLTLITPLMQLPEIVGQCNVNTYLMGTLFVVPQHIVENSFR